MTELGKTHWKINLLRGGSRDEWVYAVIAPTVSMNALMDDNNEWIDAEPKPEDWHDVKLMEGTLKECLDWIHAIHYEL